MSLDEILALGESNWVEKTAGFGEPEKNHSNFRDKLCKNVAAFANDISVSGKDGYFIVGIDDKTNQRIGFSITDKQLRDLITDPINSHGNIQPNPAIAIEVDRHDEGDIVIIKVSPSIQTPVRYKKTIYIRRGPTLAAANAEEERILIEKSVNHQLPFESQPCINATLDDIDLDKFRQNYLPLAVSERVLEENNRSIEMQLASLGFWNTKNQCPTNLGVLCFGKDPQAFFPMAYIQYVYFIGETMTSGEHSSKEIKGTLVQMIESAIQQLEPHILEIKVGESGFRHERKQTYPYSALREALMNAILHRDYQTPSPIKLYVFSDHFLIENPGGYFGNTTAIVPLLSRYRNSRLAEVLKYYGLVEKFGVGMERIVNSCRENGNPEPIFDYADPTYFKVTIHIHSHALKNKPEPITPSIVFFNNKGGVGKTTLLYHVAWTLADMGHRVLVADYDPQSNLTAAFLTEDEMEAIAKREPSDGQAQNIYQALRPIEKGTGLALPVQPYEIEGNTENGGQIYLIPGHIGLSKFEDRLSDAWSRAADAREDAFQTVTALHRIAYQAAQSIHADYILIDVAPNLGALNRCILITTQYLVIPIAPDLFSLLGLENMGPVIKEWKKQWRTRLRNAAEEQLPILSELPKYEVAPLGYIMTQHNVRKDKPVKAYNKYVDRIGPKYVKYILEQDAEVLPSAVTDSQIGLIKNYHSLIPMAQNARKPIFKLTFADGAIGAHLQMVLEAGKSFEQLTDNIIERIAILT
jgi:chromosome partitioning protein